MSSFSKIREDNSLLQFFQKEYNTLPVHMRREIDVIITEYYDLVDVIIREQRYEDAAKLRDKYKHIVGQGIKSRIHEWLSYNNELRNYLEKIIT